MAKENESLKLNDNVKVNDRGQVILGRLEGPCADFVHATRNGRVYDQSLWKKVFNDPIVNEYFESGGIPGELDHPTDRLDTCSEKIAIMMPEKPHEDANGNLIASFDILDTPNGRIVYTLAKYGYKLGISSRGGGDTYIDENGQEHVDEDSYDFRAFDVVLLPAVKAARLKLAESLQNGKTFAQAINESLQKAKPEEKKIMQETLSNLNIEYNHESVIDNKTTMAANDVGADVIKQLQESLLAKQKLEAKVTELQEKLSVSYAKEAKLEEDLDKYKSAVQNLSAQASNAKTLQKQVTSLKEELDKTKEVIKQNETKNNSLVEKYNAKITDEKSLTEKLSQKDNQLKQANTQIFKLQESLRRNKVEANERLEQVKNELTEQLEEQKKNLSIKTSEYSNKLANSNKLIEQYRTTAKKAVTKYIESQALRLGLKTNEILEKLPRNYSFTDIDAICEELGNYKLSVSKLPFDLEKSKVTIKESKETLIPKNRLDNDIVDSSLLSLAGINNN